tara:strand:+ start:2526 stop:2936 length:411 start_codon:yes stop_codon:yes gene_type:complete
MIVTANSWFNRVNGWEGWLIGSITQGLSRYGLQYAGIDSTSQPIEARVNMGRWIVDCECGGAEFAWDEGFFMCQMCWNSAHKHQVRLVVFPEARLEIEALLEQRPLLNRHWFPHESVVDLISENNAHEAELIGGDG